MRSHLQSRKAAPNSNGCATELTKQATSYSATSPTGASRSKAESSRCRDDREQIGARRVSCVNCRRILRILAPRAFLLLRESRKSKLSLDSCRPAGLMSVICLAHTARRVRLDADGGRRRRRRAWSRYWRAGEADGFTRDAGESGKPHQGPVSGPFHHPGQRAYRSRARGPRRRGPHADAPVADHIEQPAYLVSAGRKRLLGSGGLGHICPYRHLAAAHPFARGRLHRIHPAAHSSLWNFVRRNRVNVALALLRELFASVFSAVDHLAAADHAVGGDGTCIRQPPSAARRIP